MHIRLVYTTAHIAISDGLGAPEKKLGMRIRVVSLASPNSGSCRCTREEEAGHANHDAQLGQGL